jgi:excisionase family DNA binding protein
MDRLHQKLFTTSQVANVLGVSRITVFRWIKDGTIAALRIGRNYFISEEELQKHIATRPITGLDKSNIQKLVDKVVTDYGETIRMLGRE